MISSNDFRTGTSIELDGQVWRVVEFLHVKPGKGSAFVRTKLKAVQSGNVVEKTFRAGEMLPQAILEKSTLQHTYMEGDDYVFMDMGSYEETRLTAKQIGDSRKYLKEGMEVNVVAWNGKPLEVNYPTRWCWRSPRPIRVSRAIRPRAAPSLRSLKRAPR